MDPATPLAIALQSAPVLARRDLLGRVKKLMLGRPVEGTVSECDNCGHVQPRADGPCIFCGNTSLHRLEADEGLIRQAVLIDAEILTFDGDEVPALPEPLVCFAIEKRQQCHAISLGW
jgi:hypothetical protein